MAGDGLLHGAGVESDPCLAPMLRRECYFLNKLIPRHENLLSILRASFAAWGVGQTFTLVLNLALFAGMVIACSSTVDDATLCEAVDFKSYFPAILNVLATFLLGFYCSSATAEYSHASRKTACGDCTQVQPAFGFWECTRVLYLGIFWRSVGRFG